jgi:hypothetical protein
VPTKILRSGTWEVEIRARAMSPHWEHALAAALQLACRLVHRHAARSILSHYVSATGGLHRIEIDGIPLLILSIWS